MKKKQNLLFLLGLSFTLIVIYLLFNPKTSSFLNPYKRRALWNDFVNQTLENKEINSRDFWKLREFYYPGNIIFKREGFSKKEIYMQIKKEFSISLLKNEYFYPFMKFQSDKIISLEALVETNKRNEILINSTNEYNKTIFQDSSTIIYNSTNNNVVVIFIKPVTEMIKTNGYLDYRKHDKELIKNKYWLVISKINLN